MTRASTGYAEERIDSKSFRLWRSECWRVRALRAARRTRREEECYIPETIAGEDEEDVTQVGIKDFKASSLVLRFVAEWLGEMDIRHKIMFEWQKLCLGDDGGNSDSDSDGGKDGSDDGQGPAWSDDYFGMD